MGNYVFLGPPGAGKGTMAAMLCDEFKQSHISTGEILRKEIRDNSDLGAKAQQYMDAGRLVPDELVASIVERTLCAPTIKESGFVLDGYPRTLRQAELLEDSLHRNELVLDAAVLLDVSRELLIRRLTARRVCAQCGAVFNTLFSPPQKAGVCDRCGGELELRDDDRPETIEQRLRIYEQQTEPVIRFFDERGLLKRTDGEGERQQIYANLKQTLDLNQ
ncbi:MAG: adenylate kinase [Verrucomicrobiota bacterium]